MSTDAAFLVCTTQRSGSNLLCQLLQFSGVAGRPEEYFAPRFYDGYSTKLFGLPAYPKQFGDYLSRVLARRTDNGVFGATMMWNYLPDFCSRVRSDRKLPSSPKDAALVHQVFGEPRYLWLRRRNKVRQAISMARALLTDHWVSKDKLRRPPKREVPVDHFDYERIESLVNDFERADADWARYFEKGGHAPIVLDYEDFVAATETAVPAIIEALDIELPAGFEVSKPTHERQSDSLSQDWYDRFWRIRREKDLQELEARVRRRSR